MSSRPLIPALSFTVLALLACARQPGTPQATDSAALHQMHHPTSDSAFAALQQRGKTAMGVDQYASRHQFEALPDGGRIALQQPGGDSAAVRTIRSHMQEITRSFANGDFTTPAFVHNSTAVPGTAVLAAKKNVIRYDYRPLPEGGEVRIYTTDPDALAAIREFMAFQRSDHRS